MKTSLRIIGAAAAVSLALPLVASAQTACTANAMICPDGTVVGATGPSCSFDCSGHTGAPTQSSAPVQGTATPSSVAVTATPTVVTSSNAAQVAQLTAQIQTLLAQVSALQAQVGTGGSSAPVAAGGSGGACLSISRTLGPGSTGADVSTLQQFLIGQGLLPSDDATGFYGSLTQAAVAQWQSAHGIVSSGNPSTTGFGQVGPSTRAAMASACSGAAGSTGAAAAGPVGGFIQVTPVAGNAPLTVKVTATVNTTNSCTGATYTLDWGDGTVPQQIIAPSGSCAQLVQQLTHVYPYGGTFRVMLSAGSHQTYATVTVSGASAPVSGGTPAVSGGNGCGSEALGVPNETINASPATGNAPLTVTFSGTVNSNDAGFCAADRNDALDFGDGTYAQVALPASVGGWLNYSISHTYTSAGGFVATLHQGAITSNQVVGHVTITVNQPSSGVGSNTFGIVSVTPTGPQAVSLVVTLPSCAQYQIDWGDNSPISTATASCTNGGSTATIQHTYPAPAANTSASYTIKLKNGSGTTQASTGITISA